MIVTCPHCNVDLEVDDGYAGQVVDCPECGNAFEIPKLPKIKVAKKVDRVRCYVLGLLLGVVGVYIAYMIEGPKGVGYALRGLFFQIIIGIGLYMVFATM